MGGKALQNYGVFTKRIPTKEFNRISDEIQKQIHSDFNGILETSVVKCYHQKETHGDLDLLIKINQEIHNMNINLKTYIKNTFKPTVIVL